MTGQERRNEGRGVSGPRIPMYKKQRGKGESGSDTNTRDANSEDSREDANTRSAEEDQGGLLRDDPDSTTSHGEREGKKLRLNQAALL